MASPPDPNDRRATEASPRPPPHWVRSVPLRAAQQAWGRRARARSARLRASGRRWPTVQRVGGLARWHPCDSQHAPLLAAARAPNLCADRAVLCACTGLSRKAPSRVSQPCACVVACVLGIRAAGAIEPRIRDQVDRARGADLRSSGQSGTDHEVPSLVRSCTPAVNGPSRHGDSGSLRCRAAGGPACGAVHNTVHVHTRDTCLRAVNDGVIINLYGSRSTRNASGLVKVGPQSVAFLINKNLIEKRKRTKSNFPIPGRTTTTDKARARKNSRYIEYLNQI